MNGTRSIVKTSSVSLLRSWPNDSIFTRFLLDKKSREKEPFGYLVEWVEWTWVKLSEVWSLTKKSSRRKVVEWKSTARTNRSFGHLVEEVEWKHAQQRLIGRENSCNGKYFWLIYVAEIWVVEKSREKLSEKSIHLITLARLGSTLRSNVEDKIECKIESLARA